MPRIGSAGTFPANLELPLCHRPAVLWLMPAHVCGWNATLDAPLIAESIRRVACCTLRLDAISQ
jgi:hypothetical protein